MKPLSIACERLNGWTRRLRALPIIALFAAVLAANANAGDWFTRTWRTDDGLLDNTITAVAQTADGFLWVGTSAGLVRFDGVSFTEVSYLPNSAEQDPNVRILLPSRSGGLWIVPEIGAIVCLDSNFARVPLAATNLPNENVIAITEDAESLWISYADGSVFRVRNSSVNAEEYGANAGVPEGTVNSFVTDNEGNIWLAKGTAICVLRDDRFEPITTTKGRVHVMPARTNGVWVTINLDVYQCDKAGPLRPFGSIQSASPMAVARTLTEDRTGAVWVGTDGGGLYHWSGSGFDPVEVSHSFVSCLAEDSEGNIWAGTLGGGLNRVFPGAIQLQGIQDGASLVTIQSVCEDKNGVLWGATQNGSLVCSTGADWIVPEDPTLAAITNLTCVAQYRGDLYMGFHGKVGRWHNHTLTSWDTRKGVLGTYVTQMMMSSNGNFWICQGVGVGLGAMAERLDNGKVFTPFKLPKSYGRRAVMAEDAQGTIWLGTSGGMLLQFNGEEFVDVTAQTGLAGRAIRNLYATPDGSLWIGYGGWGLGRIKDGKFSRLTSERGLHENYISQITGDDEGWFWFGGNRGIFKVRQTDLEAALENRSAHVSPIVCGINEGMLSQQADYTDPRGLVRTGSGKILMPMRSALAVINPKIRRDRELPPVIHLTRVAVDEQPIASYGALETSLQAANLKTLRTPLRLDPRHRKLEFQFSALSFAAPENVHFRYRLDGLDDNWVDGGVQRAVHYSRLPAGNYQFRVSACNSDGIWNESGAPLALIVAPFFWQTTWFRLTALLVFSSMLIGLARYISLRRVRFQLQALEQQAALDKSRMAGMAEVAASVLHNVGNVLNSVNVSSSLIREKVRNGKTGKLQKAVGLMTDHAQDLPDFLANDPKGKQLPQYLAGLAQHFVKEEEGILREIVSLDENIEHIKEIVASQQRYSQAVGVQEVFKPADVVDDALRIHTNALVESRVEVVREYDDVPVVATDKHKVLQILVNLIGNARQALETSGSDRRQLTVRVTKNSDERVVVSVKDNGIGIPRENLTRIFQQGFAGAKNGHGMGLHSGANAAHELGGLLLADSQGPGTGATFTLEFPAIARKPA
jgi:signal transduction histidine kinase/ligand-binding sensor domain-containing protein